MAWFKVFHADLILLALKVDITVSCVLWLFSVLEESVVKHLVIDVDFTHFWLHTLSHLLFKRLLSISISCLLPQATDSSLLNKLWQLEGDLMDTPLVLEIASLLSPVTRHWHRVPHLLAGKKEKRLFGGDIPRLNEVWPLHLHLEVKNLHLGQKFALLFSHFLFLLPLRSLKRSLIRSLSIWRLSVLLWCVLSYHRLLAHRGVFASLFNLGRSLLIKPLKDLHKLNVGIILGKLFHLISLDILKLNFRLFSLYRRWSLAS
jgi:hypothetical protein